MPHVVGAPAFVETVGSVVVLAFFGDYQPTMLQAAQAALRDLPDTGQMAFMVYVGPAAKPPDTPGRKAYAAMLRDYAHRSFGTACLIPGTGFLAAMQRGVVTSLELLSNNQMPLKVFKDIDVGAEWLRARGLRTDNLERARARLDAAIADLQGVGRPNAS